MIELNHPSITFLVCPFFLFLFPSFFLEKRNGFPVVLTLPFSTSNPLPSLSPYRFPQKDRVTICGLRSPSNLNSTTVILKVQKSQGRYESYQSVLKEQLNQSSVPTSSLLKPFATFPPQSTSTYILGNDHRARQLHRVYA